MSVLEEDIVMQDCKEELNSLLNSRKEIENKISDLNEILNANKIGMHEKLVDSEGYPRNDINVYEVRHARAKIIRLQTDYNLLMKKCEEMLLKFHSQDLPEFKDKPERPPLLVPSDKKLALVGKVEAGSPSEYAGLKEGDVVLQFGNITADNMKNINDISEEVKRSVNMYLKVVVKREGQLKRINLKPKSWSGRGYLGCILTP